MGALYQDVHGVSSAGAAEVFVLKSGKWRHTKELNLGAKAGGSDIFGASVSLDAAGTKALIGAPGRTEGGVAQAGAAELFTFSHGQWGKPVELSLGKNGGMFDSRSLSAATARPHSGRDQPGRRERTGNRERRGVLQASLTMESGGKVSSMSRAVATLLRRDRWRKVRQVEAATGRGAIRKPWAAQNGERLGCPRAGAVGAVSGTAHRRCCPAGPYQGHHQFAANRWRSGASRSTPWRPPSADTPAAACRNRVQ